MSEIKPISLLIVEDDIDECNILKNYINTREDIKLIGTANSTYKALEYVKTHVPDAIILDLELNDGEGSGLEVLENIKQRHILETTREINPLRKADDAILVDSTTLSIEEVKNKVIEIIKGKMNV